ncbi:MAG: succinylglutamate desuccinylase/aspartoacylase family protein [Patescibacteria group bacterium]
MLERHLPAYSEFISSIEQQISRKSDVVLFRCGALRYEAAGEAKTYDFVKIQSHPIADADPILLIRAGIHGDEIAGPLTIMNHVGEIIDYAHARGVKLVIFPLDNPSGFERNMRYNMEGDFGNGGNNDFIRYELENGDIVDDLGTGNAFKCWHWASDLPIGNTLPKETAMLHAELKKLPLSRVKAVIDLHQDNYIRFPGAYHYAYGDVSAYRKIVEDIRTIVPVFINEHIDSGYLNGPSYRPEQPQGDTIVVDPFDPVTDDLGFIIRHDCTLPDLFWRLGTKHCITVETTAVTPPEISDAVNMVWIRGLIDLAAP